MVALVARRHDESLATARVMIGLSPLRLRCHSKRSDDEDPRKIGGKSFQGATVCVGESIGENGERGEEVRKPFGDNVRR